MFELVEPNKSSELNLAVSSSCRPPDGWTGASRIWTFFPAEPTLRSVQNWRFCENLENVMKIMGKRSNLTVDF